MFDAVSCAIPGAKNEQQASDNVTATDLPEFSAETMTKIGEIYNQYIRDDVHHRW